MSGQGRERNSGQGVLNRFNKTGSLALRITLFGGKVMADNFINEKDSEGAKRFADVVGTYLQSGGEGGKVENFADLLDSYNAGMNENLQVGEKIRGEIIAVGKDSVFVNTGTKIDGSAEKKELLNEKGEFPYQVGDVLELYVVAVAENEIRLSAAISGAGGLNILRDAFAGRIPVEGKVTEECKGGFHVEIMQQTAFCPVSQMDLKFVEKPADYVGTSHRFRITRFEENGRNIVVSRRILLEKELEKSKKAFLEKLVPGAVLEGKISSLMPYGAFVELFPGIEGMAHVSELSWSRVEKPEDILNQGDTVRVKVIKIEPGKKEKELKISLSVKEAEGDPWENVGEKFRAGDKVKGKVTRCAAFGAFVEIAPGIEGLVHISEMSYTKRVMKPEEAVHEGEFIDVLIKDIDLEKRRVSLSLRDAEGDPWTDIGEKYSVGQSVTGTVEKKEKFGFFITLEPGITGLLPKSKISKAASPSALGKLKEGDSVTVMIEEIHPADRKITLGTGEASDEGDWQKYAKGVKASSVGSFGEKLQQAMKVRSEK